LASPRRPRSAGAVAASESHEHRGALSAAAAVAAAAHRPLGAEGGAPDLHGTARGSGGPPPQQRATAPSAPCAAQQPRRGTAMARNLSSEGFFSAFSMLGHELRPPPPPRPVAPHTQGSAAVRNAIQGKALCEVAESDVPKQRLTPRRADKSKEDTRFTRSSLDLAGDPREDRPHPSTASRRKRSPSGRSGVALARNTSCSVAQDKTPYNIDVHEPSQDWQHLQSLQSPRSQRGIARACKTSGSVLSEVFCDNVQALPPSKICGGVQKASKNFSSSFEKGLQPVPTPECQLRELKGQALRMWDAQVNPERSPQCPLSDRARAIVARVP